MCSFISAPRTQPALAATSAGGAVFTRSATCYATMSIDGFQHGYGIHVHGFAKCGSLGTLTGAGQNTANGEGRSRPAR